MNTFGSEFSQHGMITNGASVAAGHLQKLNPTSLPLPQFLTRSTLTPTAYSTLRSGIRHKCILPLV